MWTLDVAGVVMLVQVAMSKSAVLGMGVNSGCAAGGIAAGWGAWGQTDNAALHKIVTCETWYLW